MEIVNIENLSESPCENVLKIIPIMTDEVLASVIFIHPGKKKLKLRSMDTDIIYYVCNGKGKITVGEETSEISQGALILVPSLKLHHFSTSEDELIILNVRLIKVDN